VASLLEDITDGRNIKGGRGMVGSAGEAWVAVRGWVGTGCKARVLVGALIMGRSGTEDAI